MKFIDMHCDSVMLAMMMDRENQSLYDSKFTMVDFKRMQAGDQLAQCFAVFLPPEGAFQMMHIPEIPDDTYIAMARQCILDNVAKHQDIIQMAYSAADIKKNAAEGKMSAILTMEDGRAVQGSLDKLKAFHDQGFRAISLTWNAHNCFGAPNSADPKIMMEGLTDFGKEAVVYMQELGILVDVSHLSEGGFYDVAKLCKKPFVATHSNARALSPHQRNLTDDQVRTLADAGGVTGLNFGPEFLNADTDCHDTTAALIAKHARHLANVGGVDVVGLGTDFDGIRGNLEIGSSDKMPLLVDALAKEGFSMDEIEKIFHKNVLRVMEAAMK